MALLKKVQLLSDDCHRQLIQFYESPEHRFSIEIRNLFDTSIEEVFCGGPIDGIKEGLDPYNPEHFLKIKEFLSNLIAGLETRIANSNASEVPFFMPHKLTQALQELKSRMTVDSLGLFQTIRKCILFELSLVQASSPEYKSNSNSEVYGQAMEKDEIMADLEDLQRHMLTAGELLRKIMTEQETFEINCNEKQTMNDYLTQVQNVTTPNEQTQNFEKTVKNQISVVESKLQMNVKSMLSMTVSFEESVESNLNQLSILQDSIKLQIQLWKYEQQLEANGLIQKKPMCLTKLKVWCEELANLIWTTRTQLKEAQRLHAHNPILGTSGSTDRLSSSRVPQLMKKVTRYLSELLSASFLVENQPPQVMKLGTKFPTPVTLSLLVGIQLNVQMTSPVVTTCIISESQAEGLNELEDINKNVGGDIVNGNSKLEFNQNVKRLRAEFQSMQLKRIKRADKKGGVAPDSVMEEKFCLLFESVVTVGELNIRIRTISMPVVVISHGSQEALGVATITWDNAFGELARLPFQVPKKVSWADLAQVLSLKFQTATGRGLSEDHLRCLKQKAFRGGSHSEFITWNEFCKDNLPDRSFSFWDWFYSAMKIIERKDTYLKEIWQSGLIYGFIERQSAENLLIYRPPGTFLIRFSDSLTGAITIAWIHEDSNVYLVNPFQLHDLQKDKLADSINGLEDMKFLYPDVPKYQAFGKHCTPPSPIPERSSKFSATYVKPKMILNISGSSSGHGTPSRTPDRDRSRSNSWVSNGQPIQFLNGGQQLHAGTSPVQNLASNPDISFQPEFYNWMDVEKESAATSAFSHFAGHLPNPSESANRLPDFNVLGETFAKCLPCSSEHSNVSNEEEPMQITLDDQRYQFSDLLTIIRSDLNSTTY